MATKLLTILKKLESVRSETNRIILKNLYEYMRSKDLKSDHHIINLFVLLISLDKFLCSKDFTSINTKEQILTFLDHRQQKDGKWVKRERDVEGRYITSFNQNKRLLSVFFRWLFNSYCNNKPEEDWETPAFLKIKAKKLLRESAYDVNDIWELNDVLTIVSYEPELRNQAIITLLWDLDARPHEIIALRMRDIVLNEQYGEGIIPSNTKTGGGPILLTSSFTYVRDWINKHTFKNEPDAKGSLLKGVVTLGDYVDKRYGVGMEEDAFTRLFWDRLCQIHRYRIRNRLELRDFAIDGITKTEGLVIDRERGYLGVAGTDQPEAERRLRRFEGEGLVQIIGPVYRLTPQGEQFCASRPQTEA